MKITKRQLRRIIKEEKARLLSEIRPPFKGGYQHEEPDNSDVKPTPGGYRNDPGHALLDLDDYDDLRESLNEFAKEYAHNSGYEREDIIEAIKSVVGEL
jgi:hypothetical protein